MLKSNRPTPRPLPKLILLPMPKGLKRAKRGGRAMGVGVSAWPANDECDAQSKAAPLRTLMQNSMDEFSAVIALVRHFMVGESEEVKSSARWLDSLAGELDSLDSDLERGCYDRGVTIDDLSSLDQTLGECPEIEDLAGEAAAEFPWIMLNFWLQEVERKGRELVNIAIGCVSTQDAGVVSNALKSFRYPIR